MMNLLIANNLNGYFFTIIKIFFIVFSVLYLIFSLIVVKQVTSMSKSISDKLNGILIIFSYIHLVFSVFLVLTMFGL